MRIGKDGQMANTNHKNKETNMIRWALRTCIGLLATLGLASGVRAADPATRDSAVKSQAILLDGPDWRLAPDPGNKGREEKWFEAPRPDAKATPVPGIVQNVLPDFHGPAWYYREFEAPVNPHKDGRYLVRFGAVDYVAEAWVNGQAVGKHEGGETPFALEATETV
jgi:beta-galactosidase/beta-glucuronidase